MNSELLDRSALKAADDYCEYRRIVGDDDGGVLFTTEQYEEYKRKMLPQRAKNRLYVSFGVPGGIDCKLVGPETPCFCAHRYKQHKTDFEIIPSERPLLLPCRMKKCLCSTYEYLPHIGTIPIRCQCKHLPEHHNETDGHLCKTCDCSGFRSPYTCGCGRPSFNHQTLVETKSEREARGRPVGQDVPYAAMGGLTGFSSLLDGYIALEASGSTVSPGHQKAADIHQVSSNEDVSTSHPSRANVSLTMWLDLLLGLLSEDLIVHCIHLSSTAGEKNLHRS